LAARLPILPPEVPRQSSFPASDASYEKLKSRAVIPICREREHVGNHGEGLFCCRHKMCGVERSARIDPLQESVAVRSAELFDE